MTEIADNHADPHRRVLLLGLDGATFDVLDPLMADGTMPFLRSLVAGGARAQLRSTHVPVTPQAWTAIATGRSPGHHGIFDFVRAREARGGMYFTLTNSRDIRAETLWAILTRLGRRSIVLNFPATFPPRPLAGAMVPGFVPWRHLRRYCYPPGMYEQLTRLPGFSARDLAMDIDLERKSVQGLDPSEHESWLDLHRRRERQWHDVLAELMTTTPWDFAAIVFDGVDKLQHAFWSVLDPAHLDAGDPVQGRTRERCLCYFRELDGHLAHLVGLAGPDTHVLAVSDHGFGPTDEIFYVNEWLHAQGFLHWADSGPVQDTEDLTVERLKHHVTAVDWDRTLAYALTPSSNGIHIRVAEGSGDAGVKPGQYLGFRRELADALLEIEDPHTGEPVVTRVATREEAYPGPCMPEAPDLTLSLRDGGFVSVVRSPTWLRRRTNVQGTHRPDGIFAAYGPGVRAGTRLDRHSILDVAPTVLHLLGEEVPADFEGSVTVDALTPSFRRSHPVRTGDRTMPVEAFPENAEAQPLNPEATRDVYARLQALGYLEE
jgi:predicted AlkP superfamily phosphohydrolase/phosphomutase